MTSMRFLLASSAATLLLLAAPQRAAAQAFKPGSYLSAFNGMALEAEFSDSGRVTIKADNAVVVTGSFALKGDVIELRDVSGPLACSPDQVGRYKWSLEDKTLTFILVSDECQGRIQSVAGQAWTRKDAALALLPHGRHRIDP